MASDLRKLTAGLGFEPATLRVMSQTLTVRVGHVWCDYVRLVQVESRFARCSFAVVMPLFAFVRLTSCLTRLVPQVSRRTRRSSKTAATSTSPPS